MHKQQSRVEISRHTWHRQESDESSESVHDYTEPGHNAMPRSNTFPCNTTANQQGATVQSSVSQYGGTTGARVQRTARMPMGGWEEEPVVEEGSEDELPPHVHKVT
ncbi:hypothetical protein KOW79_010378 [Hemibagrus wyckioides]|uniref:Uncharacterized protein n=3 Tax=Hemibagrus wyckioides TaxID=337641 RepID=A0A9D3SK33_9TELE|nr:hypothetical protein KOW79_010378 [Hemibagrus wyckioides]